MPAVVVDLVLVACQGCQEVRRFEHDPPLAGPEELIAWLGTIGGCPACGGLMADIKARTRPAAAPASANLPS